jgi:glycosyltransferase involved in cell wall biosynthesis
LLEAMALARPIVASAVGGIPEMLVDGESGVLFRSGDAPELAGALVRLLTDRAACARLGAGAYARLTTAFTLERFATAMFDAFACAAAGGR